MAHTPGSLGLSVSTRTPVPPTSSIRDREYSLNEVTPLELMMLSPETMCYVAKHLVPVHEKSSL